MVWSRRWLPSALSARGRVIEIDPPARTLPRLLPAAAAAPALLRNFPHAAVVASSHAVDAAGPARDERPAALHRRLRPGRGADVVRQQHGAGGVVHAADGRAVLFVPRRRRAGAGGGRLPVPVRRRRRRARCGALLRQGRAAAGGGARRHARGDLVRLHGAVAARRVRRGGDGAAVADEADARDRRPQRGARLSDGQDRRRHADARAVRPDAGPRDGGVRRQGVALRPARRAPRRLDDAVPARRRLRLRRRRLARRVRRHALSGARRATPRAPPRPACARTRTTRTSLTRPPPPPPRSSTRSASKTTSSTSSSA